MRSLFLVAACVLLTGCTTPAARPADAAVATLDEPPAWAPGDWWNYKVHDFTADVDYEVQVVVASLEGDVATLAVPRGSFNHSMLHVPGVGLGEVGRADLSYAFQGAPFQVIQFPLREGATWTTRLQGNPLDAEVVAVDGDQAHVEMHGPASDVYYTYDARVGQVTEFLNDNWVSYRLTASGRGFAGELEWPTHIEQRINQGHFALVVGQSTPPEPVQTLVVEDGVQYMSLFLYAGPAILPDPASSAPTAGYFVAEATDPRGTSHTAHYGPAPQPGPDTRFERVPEPAGTWQWATLAAGAGTAAISGVSYDLAVGEPSAS